jgi:DNA (cytosine-5)-methyltransferase 1
MNYYNEFDPFAAKWLRGLISAGLILDGYVDERSIKDVNADDLDGYLQCHFFAGVGGWSRALEIAAWPEGTAVWTGSCPCQPFSGAGKRQGTADERHLWPEFRRLIKECLPPVVLGEQVASKDGRNWLAGVRADLEALGYAVGAADLCAAGQGAPHIRQRLWWVGELGDAHGARQRARRGPQRCERRKAIEPVPATGVSAGGLGIPSGDHLGRDCGAALGAESQGDSGRAFDGVGRFMPGSTGANGWLGNANLRELPQSQEQPTRQELSASTGASWADHWAVRCSDGTLRRVGAGVQPLAHGIPVKLGQGRSKQQRMGIRAARANRIGRLRGYGNAIVPDVAAEFVRAYLLTRCQ